MNNHGLKRYIVNNLMGGEFGKIYEIYQKIFHKKRVERLYEKKKIKITGLNRNKKFLVIRQPYENTGLMANINWVLVQLDLCEQYGRIPVVDMKNYRSVYHSEEDIGVINTWEYFFEPLSDYSLEEVYRSCNYLLSGRNYSKIQERLNSIDNTQTGNPDVVSYWNKLFCKYIKLNSDMELRLNRIYDNMFSPLKQNNKKYLV